MAHAQELAFLAHQSWSTEEGLPQASVHAILQTADGYLWIATEGGAARFDGVSWRSYTHENTPALTSDDISSLAETPAGVLWLGTSDGLLRLNGGSPRRFTERDGLPSAAILSLARAGDGTLLVLTAAGLARLDETGVHALPPAPSPPVSLERTADGTVWMLSKGEPLRYAAGTFVPVPVRNSGSDPVASIAAEPNGQPWVVTTHGTVFTGTDAHRASVLPPSLAGVRVQTALLDRNGVAWVGTNRGLFAVPPQTPARPERAGELGTESILSLAQDREGDLWIGSETTGVHILRPRAFRLEQATAGESPTAVTEATTGLLWIGTRDNGLALVRPDGSEAPFRPPSSLTSPVILSLAPGPHGDLWAGTPDGLNHIEGRHGRTFTSADGLPDDFVRSVLASRDGSVWVGTRNGLAHIVDSTVTATYTRANGLASDSIGPLLEASAAPRLPGRSASSSPGLWVGTAAGLAQLRDGRVETIAPAAGGGAVTALAHDENGALWVALQGAGLRRFAAGSWQDVPVSGLPQQLTALARDASGSLWLRARRGLYRASLSALRACAAHTGPCTGIAERYGVADGMPSDEAAAEGSPSLSLGASGVLWVATRKGLAVAGPAHLPFNAVPPPVVLQRFAVDDTDQPTNGGDLHIGSGHRSFTFDYAALSYTMPSRVRFRYKLEGFDRDWIDAGSRRTAFYTSLPGRRYRFRVTAANNDGVWNETGATLAFAVLPPVYLRWWFPLLVFALLAAAVALAFQLRLRRVRGQFALVLNERNRVAREIHDTLAQDFVSVSLQLELIAQLVRSSKLAQATEQLQATRLLVKGGLEAARQSIWDLRANVQANALPVRLRQAVETFAQRHPGTQVKVGGTYRQLSSRVEDEVLRIATESLSNVDRHAAAAAVLVELRYNPDQLALTVRDDGAGFRPAEALERDDHYGLRGMQERALALGGRLTMTSNPGEGTTVTLEVPLGAGTGSPGAREGL